MEAYSKRLDLADALVSAVRQLQEAQAQTGGPVFSGRSTRSPSHWRVGDRLSETDIERLIAAFTAGTSKRKLAERYGISESSVKRLIRKNGASKLSSGLSRALIHVSIPSERAASCGSALRDGSLRFSGPDCERHTCIICSAMSQGPSTNHGTVSRRPAWS